MDNSIRKWPPIPQLSLPSHYEALHPPTERINLHKTEWSEYVRIRVSWPDWKRHWDESWVRVRSPSWEEGRTQRFETMEYWCMHCGRLRMSKLVHWDTNMPIRLLHTLSAMMGVGFLSSIPTRIGPANRRRRTTASASSRDLRWRDVKRHEKIPIWTNFHSR